ncbi:hypothetical protein GJ633_07270 [Halorubrum sp. CBA1125]|uniref:hypothetical protein n=1 Tax=Halorubrum sp. CBA1125 TaxID=2668072 RepID=UPI0012E756F8|nr:hypothetical protein [Halorubrum sp. CBA1125]MUW14494.1 hypothetical protein [Halorubrum sp. CBA1125]
MSPPSTSPSATDSDPVNARSDVRRIVRRYHRLERATSWTVALSAGGAFLVTYGALSLWPALGVAGALVVATRLPAFRRRGTTRLRTEAAPETVRAAFAGPEPPILAFQWGIADEVVPTDDGTAATYEFSYLFGLRNVSIDLDVDVTDASGTNGPNGLDDSDESDSSDVPGDVVAIVDIEGTANDRSWGAYTATIRDVGGAESAAETVVDVELHPTRRFDLGRLPQGLIADRYYEDALAAQGYEVVDRSVSLTVL